ncbi:hypothetical protein VZ232_08915 [Pseudomonas aeruginosa]|uniref:hypothetical protein n=1 Tax=Pseudomonas aeruginosa TaxID=287 RepID=UPI000E31900A|nr:hypothetical protein [Pseudomonas aeruginosa]MBV5548504.1 hypothetical protein [Pseudomonas aeruginosa]MBV5556787.1 hypothetical protein [Pseudomonas aeruginosa]MBV6005259.1 hypothetical protein [Pseudomonas aeruginosa]MBV6018505.1 hypothetical protein [Pseudomonas aeruginosa]MBV6030927.1 hypothetical protein [Pseudomonas aeruginosa]
MSEVKRFDVPSMRSLTKGEQAVMGYEVVLASDYDALAAEAQALREEVARAEQHRNDQADLIVSLRTEVAALRMARDDFKLERDLARKNFCDEQAANYQLKAHLNTCLDELSELRARVAVVPERKLLNAGVPGLNRNSGWNACLDELARINGMTVSEGLVQGMAKFAREIICGALDGGSFDGAGIQESAERHGLIAKHVMNEPCRGPEEYCACAWSTSFPTECYRITAELRALLSEQEGGTQ